MIQAHSWVEGGALPTPGNLSRVWDVSNSHPAVTACPFEAIPAVSVTEASEGAVSFFKSSIRSLT